MNLALFSGFRFHYEIFGYIMHFCETKGYYLTVYCYESSHQGYLDFYRGMWPNIIYRDVSCFDKERHWYDKIFLLTDDDFNYKRNDLATNDKTICIDHYYKIRSPEFRTRVTVRPFAGEYYRDWALPVFPLFNNKVSEPGVTVITILGDGSRYNTSILNRLTSEHGHIVIHAISRSMHVTKFNGLSPSVKLLLHSNIQARDLYEILHRSNYLITDLVEDKDYTNLVMSAAVPLAFSTLTPLIISSQTNSFYKFKNVIEYDKNSEDPIDLVPIDIKLIKEDRKEIMDKNNFLFSNLIVQ